MLHGVLLQGQGTGYGVSSVTLGFFTTEQLFWDGAAPSHCMDTRVLTRCCLSEYPVGLMTLNPKP